jgi:hypothetical protein
VFQSLHPADYSLPAGQAIPAQSGELRPCTISKTRLREFRESFVLARWFRFYEKKRGDRRTGSKQFASLGEALFFGVFLLAGAVFFGIMFANLVIPEWRANRQFAETQCVVDRVVIREIGGADGGLVYRPDIHIHYSVGGARHDTVTYNIQRDTFSSRAAAEARADQFVAGGEYPCWYDPMDPATAVLVRGYSGFVYVVLLVPISFIVIGGGGLIYTLSHWGTSAERRAALARIDVFESNDQQQDQYPAIPRDENLTNSPGTTLAYRLPVATAPGWALFLALAACVCWNGIVAMLVVMVIQGHRRNEPDWGLTAFVAPFVLIGIGLMIYLARQLLVTTGIGATRIEISTHPLRPGERYEILIAQAGRLSINSLEVLLACDEWATYRQGTDTRTESRRVCMRPVFRRESFEIHPGMPFESRCPLEIPRSAMHSFKTDHNEINWKLIVRGDVAGWPNFEREFPVFVYPQATAKSA